MAGDDIGFQAFCFIYTGMALVWACFYLLGNSSSDDASLSGFLYE